MSIHGHLYAYKLRNIETRLGIINYGTPRLVTTYTIAIAGTTIYATERVT